jgi:septum formation protein
VGALDDHILEKPKDEADAFRMLKMLQGNTHEVLTAICVIDSDSGREESLIKSTQIEFHPMNDSEILAYIATGEPMDKAAAYAVQGIGALFVKEIRGDFFNVVGLPLSSLRSLLKKFDIDLLDWVK